MSECQLSVARPSDQRQEGPLKSPCSEFTSPSHITSSLPRFELQDFLRELRSSGTFVRDSNHSNLIPKKPNRSDSKRTSSPYIAIPATLGLVYRAYSKKSLTSFGIVVAAATAIVHALHPWSIFFTLLVVFFLAGTAVTKVRILSLEKVL